MKSSSPIRCMRAQQRILVLFSRRTSSCSNEPNRFFHVWIACSPTSWRLVQVQFPADLNERERTTPWKPTAIRALLLAMD
jgi:hypothetical protein